MRLCFEDYVLDLGRRQLLHDGAEVPISPKAFHLRKNGTQVSGQRVARFLTLSEGDRLVLGSVEMTFRSAARRDSTLTLAGRAEE